MTVVGVSGAGKAAALRHAKQTLGDGALLLEATDDDVAPMTLLNGLAAGLNATGHGLAATDDADREEWSDRLRRCAAVLEDHGDDVPVVLLSGVDQLERLVGGGGAPGRHAADLLGLLNERVQRLGTSRVILSDGGERRVAIDSRDRGDWLADEDVWATLAPAAARVGELGVEWRCLPALTLRMLVGLAYLNMLPATAPLTPLMAARQLADEMAVRREMRPVWVAWQLVAGLRGPLNDRALEVLLGELPSAVRHDPLLRRCVLFRHGGWHLHPSLREVVRHPPLAAAKRLLPDDMVRATGRCMVEHFRDEAFQLATGGEFEAATAARSAAIDACAMAEDDALIEADEGELPDPYDHVGHRSAHDLSRGRVAYEHARLIDEEDATALRGLADADDRDGTDAEQVEQLYRRVVALEPRDAGSHVRLIGVLLAMARPQAAGEAFDEAVRVLAGVLDEHDLAERLCVPVARTAVAAGHLPLASQAAVLARGSLSVSEAQELDRLVEGLVETLEYGEFVAPHRLGTRWWIEPELLAELDVDRRPLSRWLAARVDAVDATDATVHYADVLLPVAPDQRPERAWTTISLADLLQLSRDRLPDPLPGAILEVGVYGDGQKEGSTVVRVARAEPVLLPEAELPLDRYVHQPA